MAAKSTHCADGSDVREDNAREAVACAFRQESGAILATLIRVVGDFDLADEAMQDAFASALRHWPAEGVPDNVRAWITTVAKRKAIDRVRRHQVRRRREIVGQSLREAERVESAMNDELIDNAVGDDPLRLIFTCCHPSLAFEAQVALTLRTLCGLTTPEIARAFVLQESTLAQRITRAKRKIREAGIPYRIPPDRLLPERVEAVLMVIYLVFNEGYAASIGDAMIRRELCAEAIRLGRVLVEFMPDEPEAMGLLALMLLQDSRRDARVGEDEALILLEDQNRSLWDREQISEAFELLQTAQRRRRFGQYQVQAAIAAEHARAIRAEDTDWHRIVQHYDVLVSLMPNPVVKLNRAVAVAMACGPEEGLALVESLASSGELVSYHYLHATKADLLRRLDRRAEAREAYRRAISCCENEAERTFLKYRLDLT